MKIAATFTLMIVVTASVTNAQQPDYILTFHTHVASHDLEAASDVYMIKHGSVLMKVTYFSSQKVGGDGKLHYHHRYSSDVEQAPDLSQIPVIGSHVAACVVSDHKSNSGDDVIAIQPTNRSCMYSNGSIVQFWLSPNGPAENAAEWVQFDIVSEKALK